MSLFIAFLIGCLHPRSLTVRPWKMVVGRRSFPIGKGTFQGRTVKLRGCKRDCLTGEWWSPQKLLQTLHNLAKRTKNGNGWNMVNNDVDGFHQKSNANYQLSGSLPQEGWLMTKTSETTLQRCFCCCNFRDISVCDTRSIVFYRVYVETTFLKPTPLSNNHQGAQKTSENAQDWTHQVRDAKRQSPNCGVP